MSMLSSQDDKFTLPLPFGSIQTLSVLDDTHPHWGGPRALLSSPIQV